MSTYNYWTNSAGGGSGNLGGNWSLGHVPTTGEVAYFDSTSIDDCTFSASINCDGLYTASSYTGDLLFGVPVDYIFGASGLWFANNGTINMNFGGNPSNQNYFYLSGNFDFYDFTGAGFNTGYANIIFETDAKMQTKSAWGVKSTELKDNVHLDLNYRYGVQGVLANYTNHRGLILGSGSVLDVNTGSSALVVASFLTGSGTIQGNQFLVQKNYSVYPGGFIDWEGTIGSLNVFNINSCSVDYFTFPSGDYSNATRFYVYNYAGSPSYGVPFESGNYIFNQILLYSLTGVGIQPIQFFMSDGTNITCKDYLQFKSNVGCSGIWWNVEGKDVNLTLEGDVDDAWLGGDLVWNKGGGVITLTGTANQDIDFVTTDTLEKIVVDKSAGSVVFSGDVDSDGIECLSTSSADMDFSDSMNHSWGSDGMVFDHAGDLDLGDSATHNITGGDYDTYHASSWITNTAGLSLAGACDIRTQTYHPIRGGLTTQPGSNINIYANGLVVNTEDMTNYGNVTVSLSVSLTVQWANLYNKSTGVITGSTLQMGAPENGEGIKEQSGSITTTDMFLDLRTPDTNYFYLSSGTYAPDRFVVRQSSGNGKLRPIGDVVIANELEFQNSSTSSITFDLATNDPNVTCSGDLRIDLNSTGDITFDSSDNFFNVGGQIINEITGGGLFLPNGQNIRFVGTQDQNIDLISDEWGLVTVDKPSGVFTFTDDVVASGFYSPATSNADIDFGDGFSHSWGEDGMVFGHTGELDWGNTTTHTTTGSIDTENVANTITYWEDVTIFLNGIGKTINTGAGYDSRLNDVVLNGEYSVPSPSKYVQINGTFDVNDGAVLTVDGVFRIRNGDLKIHTGGRVTTNSNGITDTYLVGHISLLDGVFDGSGLFRVLDSWGGDYTTFVPGYYNTTKTQILAYNSSLTLSSGNYTFNNFVLEPRANGYCTLDLTTNNSTITVKDNLIVHIDDVGDFNILSGSNSIMVEGDIIDEVTGDGSFVVNGQDLQLTGSNVQDIDLCGGDWGYVYIDKPAGSLSFTDDFGIDRLYIETTNLADVYFGNSSYTSDFMSNQGNGNIYYESATITTRVYQDQLNFGIIDCGTSHFILSGANGSVSSNEKFYDMTISAGAVINFTYYPSVSHTLDVYGKAITNSSSIQPTEDCDLYLHSTGEISGTAGISFKNPNANHGFALWDGVLSCDKVQVVRPNGNMLFPSGEYPSTEIIHDWTGNYPFYWSPSGSFVFDGLTLRVSGWDNDDLIITPHDGTIIRLTKDLVIKTVYSSRTADIVINEVGKDVTWYLESGVRDDRNTTNTELLWLPGNQTVYFTGSGDQNFDPIDCETWPTIIIDKPSGTLNLLGNLGCLAFEHRNGNFDNGGYNISTSGDFTLLTGATINGVSLNGATWSVGGDFSTYVDLSGTAPWYLNVTGLGMAHNMSAAYSDANGGSEIDAQDNCFDLGNNFNWNFIPITVPDLIQFSCYIKSLDTNLYYVDLMSQFEGYVDVIADYDLTTTLSRAWEVER